MEVRRPAPIAAVVARDAVMLKHNLRGLQGGRSQARSAQAQHGVPTAGCQGRPSWASRGPAASYSVQSKVGIMMKVSVLSVPILR